MEFKLHAPYNPTGDQPYAIEKLVQGFEEGNQFETLVGVTGSGKTFTMANIIHLRVVVYYAGEGGPETAQMRSALDIED